MPRTVKAEAPKCASVPVLERDATPHGSAHLELQSLNLHHHIWRVGLNRVHHHVFVGDKLDRLVVQAHNSQRAAQVEHCGDSGTHRPSSRFGRLRAPNVVDPLENGPTCQLGVWLRQRNFKGSLFGQVDRNELLIKLEVIAPHRWRVKLAALLVTANWKRVQASA
eukprot:scaffold31975_cov85-Phaeocystis_antarctica.AAC.4